LLYPSNPISTVSSNLWGCWSLKDDKEFPVYDDDVPEQAEEAYDKLADWYSARKRVSYEFKIQLPVILNLLGDLRSKSLLDVGCGPCVYSVEFAERGADVFGVDISQKMLEKAAKNVETANVKVALLEADAHSLPCADRSFDVVVLILTILNTRMLEEAARVLKPGGTLLFSDTHPVIEAKARWESDEVSAPLIIEDYFSQDKKKWRIENGSGKTITLKYYRRTIEQSANMIADAGFKILKIAEPKPKKSLKKSDPAHYDRCSRIPYFIIYLAQKYANQKIQQGEASAGL
jgi:ubiquinone/menaquinone biosynthesis C-methylase UbiE